LENIRESLLKRSTSF